MFQQCISETVKNYVTTGPNSSDKCISIISVLDDPYWIILVIILLYFLAMLLKLFYFFLKDTKLPISLNSFTKNLDSIDVEDKWSLMDVLMMLTYCFVALVLSITVFFGSFFLADFILSYFGHPSSTRFKFSSFFSEIDII